MGRSDEASDCAIAPVITVVATRTLDRIPLNSGGVRVESGGPAHFITQAFERIGQPFRLITGQTATVDVFLGSEGERYVIQALPPIALPERLSGPVILSPVMREIDPETVPPVDGLLAIDLQGFVRVPGLLSGREGPPVDLRKLLERATIVKASHRELQRLTPESTRALTKTVLLETLGIDGARITAGGRAVHIKARPVPVAHAIGAGDIFLAGFVSEYLRRPDPAAAGKIAAALVEAVLEGRLDPGARA